MDSSLHDGQSIKAIYFRGLHPPACTGILRTDNQWQYTIRTTSQPVASQATALATHCTNSGWPIREGHVGLNTVVGFEETKNRLPEHKMDVDAHPAIIGIR